MTGESEPRHSVGFDGSWVARSSALLLVGTMAVAVLSTAQGVALSRLLGPSGKGEVYIAILIATSVAHLMECSLGAGMQYYFARGRLPLRRAVSFALGFAGLAAIVATAIGAILILLDGTVRRSLGTVGVISVAAIVPAETLNLSMTPLFVATGRAGASAVVDALRSGCILALVLVLVGGLERSASAALAASAIAYVVAGLLAIGLIMASGSLGEALDSGRSAAFRQVLGFGVRQHLGSVLARVSKRADSYVLLALSGPRAVGIYSVASGLSEFPMMLPRSVQMAATTFTASREPEKAAEGAARLSRVVLLVMVVGNALFAGVGWILLPAVYGEQFSDARLPFVVLLASTAALGAYVVVASFLSGSGHPQLLTLVLLLPAVANVLLSIVLIREFDLPGNAAASAITSFAILLSGLIAFRRVSGVKLSRAIFPQRDDFRVARNLVASRRHKGSSKRSAS